MNVQLFKSLTKKAKNILISTHTYPDADGLGSQIALAIALKEMGKNVICVNQSPINKRYAHLDFNKSLLSYKQFTKLNFKGPIDLYIITDANSLHRIGHDIEKLVKKSKHLLFIDHHPCPQELSALHCINHKISSTGEIIGTLIKSLNLSYTKEMALALYTAILIDTNSFRYPTVTGNTHRMIAELMDYGVNSNKAYNQMYGTKKLSYMKLLGTLLSTAKTNKENTIAWITLDEQIMKKFDVDPEETHSFINHLLILDKILIACVFRQIGKSIKISLRSTGKVDVGAISLALGGGGHHHSAATIVEGVLKNVTEDTVKKLEIILKEQSIIK